MHVDPLAYQGPCTPCVHNWPGNIAVCGPCLTPSVSGDNSKFRFEPIPVTPLVLDEVAEPDAAYLAAYLDTSPGSSERFAALAERKAA
jgi:hypothetical protein